MKLFVLSNAVLQPYLNKMLPQSPHHTDVCYLVGSPHERRTQLRAHIAGAAHYDAVVLLDGTDLLPEQGLAAGELPLVMPRVHTVIDLLLGGARAYRQLFSEYDGGICWFLPGARQELCLSPREDCQCLCYLADTQLFLRDSELTARAVAQYNDWDFRAVQTDLSLLETLLFGGWNSPDILTALPQERLYPTHSSALAIHTAARI